MKGMRISAALLATVFLGIGYLLSRREPGFGPTLFLAGAMIVSAVLISSAILGKNNPD